MDLFLSRGSLDGETAARDQEMAALDRLKVSSADHQASLEGRFLTLRPTSSDQKSLALFQRIVTLARNHDGIGFTIIKEHVRQGSSTDEIELLMIELD